MTKPIRMWNGSEWITVGIAAPDMSAYVTTTDPRLSDQRVPLDGSVTTNKLANLTFTNDDISPAAQISPSKIAGTAITAADTATVTSTMISSVDALKVNPYGPIVPVGRWTGQLVGNTNYAASASTDANNTMVIWPIWNSQAMTISDVAIRVTAATGATGVFRLGFYRLDGTNNQPVTLIADCGTVSSTTTGIKTITGLSVALPAGPLGLALAAQGIASAGTYQLAYGKGTYMHSSGTGSAGLTDGWEQTVTGAFPATATTTENPHYAMPYILVKRGA